MAEARLPTVNNDVYEALDERWYDAQDDPVALLRAESACRTPWVADAIRRAFGPASIRVLDVGCGAGFLSNSLAVHGHRVTGVDASARSLLVAARHDETRSVRYLVGDARRLPFAEAAFEVVCAMDFLEHVESPEVVVAEAARVLVPGGLFFFHTFNRSWLSWLVVIKGVEWFVKNTPRQLHVLHLFLTPEELTHACNAAGLEIMELFGTRPELNFAFARMLKSGTVPPELTFTRTRSTRLSYTGFARKGVA